MNVLYQCASAIAQLTRGRNKDDKENSELQSLSAAALEKAYKKQSPSKVSALSSVLKSLKVSSWSMDSDVFCRGIAGRSNWKAILCTGMGMFLLSRASDFYTPTISLKMIID